MAGKARAPGHAGRQPCRARTGVRHGNAQTKLFGNTRQADLGTPSQFGAPPDTRMPEAESLAGTRRELVRVMARDTQRRAGIPDGWLEFQVMLEVTRNQTFVHLRIVVRHWDERLVRAQVAFQTRWLQNVERFRAAGAHLDRQRQLALSRRQRLPGEGCPTRRPGPGGSMSTSRSMTSGKTCSACSPCAIAALGSEAPADPPRPAA